MTALRASSVPAAGGIKEYLTAAEIAAEGLPDLPKSKMGMNLYAQREGWNDHPLARKRAGRGGGMEYPVSLLPVLAQVAYQQKHLVVAVPEPAADATPETGPALSARAAQERDARLAIVNAYQRFTRTLRLGHATHVQVFSDKYNAGSIQVDEWVRERVPSISKRSLVRWVSAKRDKRTAALAVDRGAARKGTGLLDTAEGGALKTLALALLVENPHFSAEHIQTQCRYSFGDEIADRHGELHPMPPIRTFQHFLKGLKVERVVQLARLGDPDKHRSHFALSGTGALRHVTHANDLWQIDASPWDAVCLDGRHSIYVSIDIACRRPVVTVSKTPRASAVGLLLKKAILRLGTPRVVSTDNGSDFTAKETGRLFAALDIEPDVCDAYSPEQKGHVERVIKTFQHSLAPQLPGYVGHSVADRKRIEGRKGFAKRNDKDERKTFSVALTAEALQQRIDAWIDIYYDHREHEGLRGSYKGMSPAEAYAASPGEIRTVDPLAFDGLLMPLVDGETRVVTKKGIQVGEYYYMTAAIEPKTTVLVRQHPTDMGRVYAYSLDGGTFLAVAECPELAHVNPAAFVQAVKEEARERARQADKDVKAAIREFRKGPAAIDRALEVYARDAERRADDATNVVRLPRRQETHTTPQIEAAKEAVGPKPAVRTKPLTGRAAEVHQAMLASMGGGEPATMPPKVTRLRQQETQQQRFRRALDIERRHAAGEPVGAEELLFLGAYRAGPEYRAMRRIHDKLGEAGGL